MNTDEFARDATAEGVRSSIAQYGRPPATAGHSHGHGAANVREAEYKGHKIVIRTMYEIEIDGSPVDAHVGVDNAGRVHYHGLPTYSFKSAVDLVKQIVDAFPDDFPPRASPRPRGRTTGRGRGQGSTTPQVAGPGHDHNV